MEEREERTDLENLADDAESHDEPAILEEVKIEEVGIDGMCGVY